MDESSRRVCHGSYARETTCRRYRVLTLIKIGTAGGRSLVRARLGWKWANPTVPKHCSPGPFALIGRLLTATTNGGTA